MQYLFPSGTPTTQSAMSAYLTNISVPACDKNGNVRTIQITCHKTIANEVKACFEEMASTKFPIKDAYCYGWREMASGTGHLSHHSYGVCIDINANENPPSYWDTKPDPSNPYYINQNIVQIWKKHGFYWGGD